MHPPRLGRYVVSLITIGLLFLIHPTLAAAQKQILRVGVVDGSPPCSYLEQKAWRGIAIDLWRFIAAREGIAYTVSEWSSIDSMLKATSDGTLDVAVECINISPDRLERYHFTLPFQEDGQAVMTEKNSLDYGRFILLSLFSLSLLKLLVAFFLVTGAISGWIWKIEGYRKKTSTKDIGALRSFANIFLTIFTGAGCDKTVITTRGNLVVSLSFIVRAVFISILVGYITISVFQESNEKMAGRVTQLEDLVGLRVGVRLGTVSESLLNELNAASTTKKAEIVPLNDIVSALELLKIKRIDAVLADELQLRYLTTHQSSKTMVTVIPVKRIRPESQAFAFYTGLPPKTISRINIAISLFKRSGGVSSLTDAVLKPHVTEKN